MSYLSPLRYPGGKRKLGPFFARLLADQAVSIGSYAEPYAGGAGAGLHLLTEGHVDKLLINDLNPGIAAFWRSILQCTDAFIERLQAVQVTLDTWHASREIYLNPVGVTDLELGFATFFLNRCNRSGILSARPIGGLNQTGRWKIDARFNREDLEGRVKAIGELAGQITVTQKPAIDFLTWISRWAKPVLLYVDPPYLTKGEDLYLSLHSWDDHESLAKKLVGQRHPWVLTYDDDDRLRSLYSSNRCLRYSISHTAHTQKVGYEYMFFSRALKVGDPNVVPNRRGVWVA